MNGIRRTGYIDPISIVHSIAENEQYCLRRGTHNVKMDIAHCACINAHALVAGGVTALHSFRRYQGLIDK
jgi:hypothetical protein